MRVILTDAETGDELWTTSRCADHIGVNAATWRGYTAQGRTPEPVATFERSPLWRAEEIQSWHAARPGSPVQNAPTSRTK